MKYKNPIIYIYFQQKFSEQTGGTNFIDLRDAKIFMAWYQIPKDIRYPILKEMEKIGLIKFESKFAIKILNPDKTKKLLDNKSLIYKGLGLW